MSGFTFLFGFALLSFGEDLKISKAEASIWIGEIETTDSGSICCTLVSCCCPLVPDWTF